MPKITNFLFCNSTDIQNGIPQALNILQKVDVDSGKFSFTIMFSIIEYTAHEDHFGHIILKNPVGEEIIRTEPFVLEKDDNDIKENNSKVISGTTIAMEFQDIVSQGSGIYSVQLILDDDKIGEFGIPILLKS